MPAGLSWVAEHQPVTPIADTLRALLLGLPVGDEAIVADRLVRRGDRDRPRSAPRYLFARR